MRRRRSLLTALLLVLVVSGALAGCVRIPDNGPVQTAGNGGGATGAEEPGFVPRGPQRGESPQDIVTHFLEAMTASPMSATVAREFLTKHAGDGWSPEDGFVTYEAKSPPDGLGHLRVTLNGVNRFDARGQWIGASPGGDLDLDFNLEPENGEWRIASVPDELIVSAAWFETQSLPVSLYYFDPGGRSLVPEPVFVPQGDQLPTLLVKSLLEGPADDRVERTYFPQGTTLNLSVTVNAKGVAEIPLSGDLTNVPPDTVALMADQIAWTLRQVPSISSARITVHGHPLTLPGGGTTFDIDQGASYDPTGTFGQGELFGLRGGLAVGVSEGEVQPLTGPFGRRDYGLRDISVELGASRVAGASQDVSDELAARQVAGVTNDGSRVLVAGVAGTEGARPTTVVHGGVDFLHPAWDSSNRLWLLDRRPDGAVVWVVTGGKTQRIDVPGVSGRKVIDFIVSRDGTRLIAAVRRPAGDRIKMSRIYAAGPRPTVRATAATTIVTGHDERLRIRDVAWRSATSIFYLNALAGRQSDLRSALVDGSPTQFDPDAFAGIYADLDTRVISSPRPEEPAYLEQVDGGGYEPVVVGSPRAPADVFALTYIG